MEYTLTVTSCGRHDLLRKTIESYVKYADISPTETVIVEDSALSRPLWLDSIGGLGNVKWISNGSRKGQTYSCDKVMSQVKTEYLMWLEDDWEFIRTGFVKESLDILEKYPKISMVSVRGVSEHKTELIPEFTCPVRVKWNGWEGISFNCGARRLSDYQRIGSYGRHVGYPLVCKEHAISLMYSGLGYRMASIDQACFHTGDNYKANWVAPTRNLKILVALQVCHKYTVSGSAYENTEKHKSCLVNEQISACRETYLKDFVVFSPQVDYKLFYGRGAERAPLDDEVFLDVPDDYTNLPHKLRAIYRWALEHGYDYIFKCDDDTYVWADRLMLSDFDVYDYVGYDWACNSTNVNHSFASGLGYWVSAKAAKFIVDSPEIDAKSYEYADDVWVGHVLRSNGIKLVHDPRYHPNNANKFVDPDDIPTQNDFIAVHACSPETIYRLHSWNFASCPGVAGNATGFVQAAHTEKSFEMQVVELMGGLEI